MAQPFDEKRLQLTGEAVPIAAQIMGLPNIPGASVFSASQGGLLAYQQGRDLAAYRLTWFDRTGKPYGVLGDAVRLRLAVAFAGSKRRLPSPVSTAQVETRIFGPTTFCVDFARVSRSIRHGKGNRAGRQAGARSCSIQTVRTDGSICIESFPMARAPKSLCWRMTLTRCQ